MSNGNPSGLPIDAALEDFLDHQRARRRSERTRDLYRQAVTRLGRWLGDEGHPTDVAEVTPKLMRGYLTYLDTQVAPGTVALHYRHLRAFWNWLAAEGEIDESPMARIGPPEVPDTPPDVLSRDELEALFASCKGRDFEQRRDLAVLMLFADTGCRLGEIAGLQVDDLNRETRTLAVHGKGDKTRVVAVGDRTMEALGRYLRSRRGHKDAKTDAMWLGRNGPMTPSGVAQILNRRAELAGVENLHPHRFRHTFAHEWLAEGGQESDLMMLAGWTSPAMVRRYGRSAASDRARDAHRRLSPVDRIGS
jgi:site-specific recombinase XerD